MAQAVARRRAQRGIRAFVDLWVGCFAKHNLLTWASAIAFQVLIALVPVVLTAWEISGSVRAIMGALNRMYETDENRSRSRRFGVSFALAIAIGACMIGSILIFTLARHLGGSLHVAVDVGRWILAIALLGIAVELLVRFAPAEPRGKKWATLGSAFTVIAWVVASLIFRVYVSSVANFRSTIGTLVAVLVLTAYLYTTAIIFLVGVQADELIRKDATSGERGLFGRLRAALG